MSGWARGKDGNGRDIGYAIRANCDDRECLKRIDRGLSFRCGDLGAESDDSMPGCGRYFCHDHLSFAVADVSAGRGGGFCPACIALIDGTAPTEQPVVEITSDLLPSFQIAEQERR